MGIIIIFTKLAVQHMLNYIHTCHTAAVYAQLSSANHAGASESEHNIDFIFYCSIFLYSTSYARSLIHITQVCLYVYADNM